MNAQLKRDIAMNRSNPILRWFLSRSRIVLPLAAMVGVLAVSDTVISATPADGDPATSDVLAGNMIVPYDGYLMIDSLPMPGTPTIRFELWDDASAGTKVWTEDQAVQLYNGRMLLESAEDAELSDTGDFVFNCKAIYELSEARATFHKPAIFSGSMFGALHAVREAFGELAEELVGIDHGRLSGSWFALNPSASYQISQPIQPRITS